MQQETQQQRYELLKSAATAATIAYATALLTATQASHYVGNPVMRDHLIRLAKSRELALAALDAFCSTDNPTQP